MNLSVVIIARDEEKNIGKCLTSVKDVADEIIIVDNFSTDRTADIAKKYKAKMYKRHLNDDFSAQKNFGISKASGDWILSLDADEEMDGELRHEIENAIRLEKYSGYFIKRSDVVLGKILKYGESGSYFLRLAKRDKCRWVRSVHEILKVESETGYLKGNLIHHSHKNLKEFIEAINYYSTLHAKENFREGKKSNLFKIVTFPIFKFLENYIFKKGFLDGGHGLSVSILMAFHSYLAWSKAYLLQKK